MYVAGLVYHPHEFDEQDARAARIIERGGVPVAFAMPLGRSAGTIPRLPAIPASGPASAPSSLASATRQAPSHLPPFYRRQAPPPGVEGHSASPVSHPDGVRVGPGDPRGTPPRQWLAARRSTTSGGLGSWRSPCPSTRSTTARTSRCGRGRTTPLGRTPRPRSPR
jgi:hypothetical protein